MIVQLQMSTADLAVIIRFKNSATTLPGVIAALKAQTVQPVRIIGVDSGCDDGSDALLSVSGATILRWSEPYHHARTLNFALETVSEKYALMLSSHTVLHAPDTLARMLAAMQEPSAACVSGKWSAHDDWSDAITFEELQRTGLRFCSIYSNSFGMIRRERWDEIKFDEQLITMEDYAWALAQVQAGHTCHRMEFPYSYQRSHKPREFAFAAITFHLAKRYGLKVGWLGWRASAAAILSGLIASKPDTQHHIGRLRAFVRATLSRGRFYPTCEQ